MCNQSNYTLIVSSLQVKKSAGQPVCLEGCGGERLQQGLWQDLSRSAWTWADVIRKCFTAIGRPVEVNPGSLKSNHCIRAAFDVNAVDEAYVF